MQSTTQKPKFQKLDGPHPTPSRFYRVLVRYEILVDGEKVGEIRKNRNLIAVMDGRILVGYRTDFTEFRVLLGTGDYPKDAGIQAWTVAEAKAAAIAKIEARS